MIRPASARPSRTKGRNLVELDFDGLKCLAALAQAELQGQECSGQSAGDGDGFAAQIAQRHRGFGDDHGAILVAHGCAATGQGVVGGDVGIGVDGDGGDFQFATQGALVEALDVLENVLELVGSGGKFIAGQGIEHECVVGIGRMSQAKKNGGWHGGIVRGGEGRGKTEGRVMIGMKPRMYMRGYGRKVEGYAKHSAIQFGAVRGDAGRSV